jgi:hypothetical protein
MQQFQFGSNSLHQKLSMLASNIFGPGGAAVDGQKEVVAKRACTNVSCEKMQKIPSFLTRLMLLI